MPAPLALAPILAAIAPWITRFLMAKGVLLFAGFLGRLGIVLATNELLVQPIIDHIMSMWVSIPAEMQCWLTFWGVTEIASIVVSGMTLAAAKQVFFSKAD